MFSNVFIANRGEIAVRIARTLARMDIRASGLFSEADARARHVRALDRAIAVPGHTPAETYLDIDKVVAAALEAGAEAVHPGYGFLSENADFADACAVAGLTFIGPPASAMRAMGSKAQAKQLMRAAGVPVVPGYDQGGDDETLARAADEVGFPLLIKASAGGGGRGMRIVRERAELREALAAARREARAGFGDDELILERYLERPRHVEVQILADSRGKVLHLGERDCSTQRRYQKVIEEAPAPDLPDVVRGAMCEAAVKAAAAVDYIGAGTVEFIVADDAHYFMEMNTRLQVEHPVTEAVTGLDLVEWQVRIAAGERLPFGQDAVRIDGHALEVRIYAEDPAAGFMPSSGRLEWVEFPGHVRVDSGVSRGDEVSTHYDSMLAKLIVHAPERDAARAGMLRALADSEVAGVRTNIAFLRRLLDDPVFASGVPDTRFVDRELERLAADLRTGEHNARFIAAALWWRHLDGGDGLWQASDGFRLNLPVEERRRLVVGDDVIEASLTPRTDGVDVVLDGRAERVVLHEDGDAWVEDKHIRARARRPGGGIWAFVGGFALRVDVPDAGMSAHPPAAAQLSAPMPGQVIAVFVEAGEAVSVGQALLVVEAMKMEHTIVAPADGRVAEVLYRVGDRVDEGAELIRFDTAQSEEEP